MVKKVGMILNFVAWLTGVLVSLSVGFSMIEPNTGLSLPRYLGGEPIAMIVGWIVVITTMISAIMAILQK